MTWPASPCTCRTPTRSATACATRSRPRTPGSRRCGRPRAGSSARRRCPLAAFGAVTERIGLGSGVVSMWVRNPAFLAATFSTLDDLAPGRVTLGIGAWWDPLAAKVGVSRDKPLRAMREIVTVVRALLAGRDGHVRRRVRAPRRRRARLRAPGAPAQAGADRDRRHRAADDAARGRDRRRRAAQLPRVAGVQRGCAGRAHRGRGAGRSHARRHRPSAARGVLDGRRPRRRARRRRACSSRSTSGSSRTS